MTTDLLTEPIQVDAIRLLFDFSEAVALQREALVGRDWTKLQQSIQSLQHAMQQISSFPGGAEGVREQLLASEGVVRERADQLIERVTIERRSSAELIRLQLQRLQALQTMTSFEEDAGLYSETGATKGRGGRLSTWV
jgi:hypothetical protein